MITEEENRKRKGKEKEEEEQPGDGPPPSLESFKEQCKAELRDIMARFKVVLDKNPGQTRQILVENPSLTRSLLQAQIMLGMVKIPEKKPTIQQTSSQAPPAQLAQSSNNQATQSWPAQVEMQAQATLSQSSLPVSHQNLPQGPQPPMSVPSASVPSMNYQLNTLTPQSSAPQNKGYMNVQAPLVPNPQTAQIQNFSMPSAVPHSLPSHMSMASNQPQQRLQTPGMFNQLPRPPLPQQPTPPMHPYAQLHPQMIGFQPSLAPQQLSSPPLFHSGITPPSSYPLGQPPLPSQTPPQLYQGGSLMGPDYNNQSGTFLQPERTPWAPGVPDMSRVGGRPLTMGASQMGAGVGGQPSHLPPLSSDMERALVQQFMSLTPEQINVLPPEKRLQHYQMVYSSIDIQSTEQGRARNKRTKYDWTKYEDEKLVECLLDLINSGQWKADNGTFRNGYLQQLEKWMHDKMPECQVKTVPHIESRIKLWEKQYCAIAEMLGSSTSGFGWNDTEKCITCDENVFDDWVKGHPNAQGLRGKSFPYLEELSVIFGKDDATVVGVEAPVDTMEEIKEMERNIFTSRVDNNP